MISEVTAAVVVAPEVLPASKICSEDSEFEAAIDARPLSDPPNQTERFFFGFVWLLLLLLELLSEDEDELEAEGEGRLEVPKGPT